jgi:hypothetical protein
MHAQERDDGIAGIDLDGGIPDEAHGQVDLARCQSLVGLDAPFLDVLPLVALLTVVRWASMMAMHGLISTWCKAFGYLRH